MNRGCWSFVLACGCSAHAATPPPKVADDDRPAPTIEVVWAPVPRLGLDEDPPEFVNNPEMPAGIVGSRRMLPLASKDISLSELPEASETRDAEPADHATFSLEAHEDSYRLSVGTDLLAEVEVDRFRAFTWAKAGSDPSRAQARRFVPADAPPCRDPKARPLHATVRGFHVHAWSEKSIRFVEQRGDYDPAVCRGAATRVTEARAGALWPGVVYAFVSREPGVGRFLHVVGPGAAWITASHAPASEQLRPHSGSLSYAKVPIDAGVSTVVLGISDYELAAFRSLRETSGGLRKVTLAYPDDVPVVRVVIDVDADTGADGIVSTSVEQLLPSRVAASMLESFAHPSSEVLAASPIGVMLGQLRAPSKPPPRETSPGCYCDPSDSLCPCF